MSPSAKAAVCRSVSWFVVAAAAALLATPWLINKRPGPRPSPSLSPVWLFAGMSLFNAAMCAGNGFWIAAGVAKAVAVAVLSVAWFAAGSVERT